MKFIEYVRNTRSGYINPKVDEIRAVFPYMSNSGYANVTSTGKFTSVLLVPTASIGRHFHLRGMLVDNSQEANYFVMYDGQAASAGLVTIGRFQIAQSKTDHYNGLDIPFESGVYISNGLTALGIRVWGLLIESEVI